MFPGIIAIGTSLGGKSAPEKIFGRLPLCFPAPILVVQHIGRQGGHLPLLLQRITSLPVRFTENDAPIKPGCALIAPPDQHLLVNQRRAWLSRGTKENYARPAIDPLFRSVPCTRRKC